MGYRSNVEGWMGAYHPDGNKVGGGMHRDEKWFGPMVDMANLAAQEAGFVINLTDAPDWVYKGSGSNDTVTQCIYAVSLGLLDPKP